MKTLPRALLAFLILCTGVGLTSAQFGGGGFGGGGGGGGSRGGFGGGFGGRGARGEGASDSYNGARYGGDLPMPDFPEDRHGTPGWSVDSQFNADVFTFVRIHYNSVPRGSSFPDGERKSGGDWLTDYPDSDLNFPFRLQQMTSMKVNPNGKRINITDPELFNYPFIYTLEVDRMELTDEEIVTLRRYLLNGGFLMIDDHWGLAEQRNWAEQMKRVFPYREQVDLTIDHPIFHCVFDLKALPQVPTMQFWLRYYNAGEPEHTWRYDNDPLPHYRAIYDDKGRMMTLQCANTDTGDGMQREGDSEEYFHRFSEKLAYPLMINVIFYSLTH